MDEIQDMKGFIRSRQEKGKKQREIADELRARGYDQFSIESFLWNHWKFPGDED